MVIRLSVTVTSSSTNQLVVATDDGQTLVFPAEQTAQVGERYLITAQPEAEAALATQELARTILAQLTAHVPVQNTKNESKEAGA